MLIEFEVANFRSFKESQIFSLETGARLRKHRQTNTFSINETELVKSAILFGANASGKTNLIKALAFLKRLVVFPSQDDLVELPTETFAGNRENTKFRLKFLKNDRIFEYQLEYNGHEVVYEKLTMSELVIFEREYQTFKVLPAQLVVIQANIRKNQLALYFAQQNNVSQVIMAYQWFAEDLVLINKYFIDSVKFTALENNQFKVRLIKFLRAADFNIIDAEVRKRRRLIKFEQGDDEPVYRDKYDLYLVHRGQHGEFTLNLNDESKGTQMFILLALNLLSKSHQVLLIDEFDESIHQTLSMAVLKVINSEQQPNQFILTSHELSLMDSDLRQDQIWFAEKNRYGESELYSLFDFNDPALRRHDFNYKKRYLAGRYGGTQMVDEELLRGALFINEQTTDQPQD